MEIRKFKQEDRDAVQKICEEQSMCKSRKMKVATCNLFLNYYLENEPDNVFVAENNVEICGYIVASAKNQLFLQQMNGVYIPKTAKSSLLMAYIGVKSLQINNVEDKNGGFNFHINVKKGYERKGIGTKLMQTMQQHMKNQGKKYMYLVTKNRRTTGYGYYSHIGFTEKKIYYYGSVLLTKQL